MSLFSRLAPSVLVLSMLAAGAGCAQPVDGQGDLATDATEATATSSAALTTALGGMDPESYLVDLAVSLVADGIDKAIAGGVIDYGALDKMFEDDLAHFADKELVRSAKVDIIGALTTLKTIQQASGSSMSDSVRQTYVDTLTDRYVSLNDDLASMRSADATKLGLRTYLWAATVQHAVLQTLGALDADHAAHYQKRLILVLRDHVDYIEGRVSAEQKASDSRVGQVGGCASRTDFSQGGRLFMWYDSTWFDDNGADGGNDPAIPKLREDAYGHLSGGASGAGTQRREVARLVNAGDDARAKLLPQCNAARTAYVTDMRLTLDALAGFTQEQSVEATRTLLEQWKLALTNRTSAAPAANTDPQ